jgi:hypothetical protein
MLLWFLNDSFIIDLVYELRHFRNICTLKLSNIIIIIINCKWVWTRWQWYYNTQYNTTHTILYNTQKTENNTYTLKTIHNTKIANTITNTMHTKL